MIFWIEIYALIVLTTMLCLIKVGKVNTPMEIWGKGDWYLFLIFSILFPLAWVFLIIEFIGPALIEERQWFWEKDE